MKARKNEKSFYVKIILPRDKENENKFFNALGHLISKHGGRGVLQ